MPDIRWVCLSDLHFGAENSLLTHIDLTEDDAKVDPSKPSKTLKAFVDCLRALAAINSPAAPKPTLVLAGDVIEFALAEDNVAAMAFERFVELAFEPGNEVFAPDIVYLPGNHDHHMWETAREKQYADYIKDVSVDHFDPPWHGTDMFPNPPEEHDVQSELLAAVFAHMGLGDRLRLHVRYPNFGIDGPDGRVVAIHHGHFTEKIYRLMTVMKTAVFPAQGNLNETAWDWESENFAWVDFFWSTLGRSGDVGSDVSVIYDMLRHPDAQRLMARNLAAYATRNLKPALLRNLARWVVALFMKPLLGRTKRLEREAGGDGTSPLTDKTRDGLRAYVDGPLRRVIECEKHPLPTDLVFVFGHTHKPFEEQWPGYGGGLMDVYNTGGWVVDTDSPDRRQGASVVVLSETLSAASVRLYNQTADGSASTVQVQSVDADTAFADRLRAAIDPAAAPWSTLSSVVAVAVPERCQAHQRLVAKGVKALNAKP